MELAALTQVEPPQGEPDVRTRISSSLAQMTHHCSNKRGDDRRRDDALRSEKRVLVRTQHNRDVSVIYLCLMLPCCLDREAAATPTLDMTDALADPHGGARTHRGKQMTANSVMTLQTLIHLGQNRLVLSSFYC